MDVKLTFLNGILEEEVYVEKPLGCVIKGHEYKVYILLKSLYGIKQVPKDWCSEINSYMITNGFNKRKSDPTLHTKVNKKGQSLILCLYVDDMIFIRNMSIDKFK